MSSSSLTACVDLTFEGAYQTGVGEMSKGPAGRRATAEARSVQKEKVEVSRRERQRKASGKRREEEKKRQSKV